MKNKHIANVRASVPASVRRFTWVRNHHFVELEDEQGHTVKLHAGGVLRGECTGCHAVVLATRNEGAMVCPHCLAKTKWAWSKVQLAFLPEHEARFMGFDAPVVDKPELTVMQRAWVMFYTAITRKAPKASSALSPERAEYMPVPSVMDDEVTPVGSGKE